MAMPGELSGEPGRGGASDESVTLIDDREDHWVSSEVQGEMQRCVSRRSSPQTVEGGGKLELVVVRRRYGTADPRFIDSDGDLDPPRAKKPRWDSNNRRHRRSKGERKGIGFKAFSNIGELKELEQRSNCVLDDAGPPQCEESNVTGHLELLVRSRTSWRLAGAQIWRAALLLAEFIEAKPELFVDGTVLELGSGVGLASIIAARMSRHVFATDGDVQALALAKANVVRNCLLQSSLKDARQQSTGNHYRRKSTTVETMTTPRSKEATGSCIPTLRLFDWRDHELPWHKAVACEAVDPSTSALSPMRFIWTRDDARVLDDLSVIIASDVLYDEDTAYAFLSAVQRILLSSTRDVTVVVALERRPVFSASAMCVVALGYDVFHEHLCLHNRALDHIAVAANRVRCNRCQMITTSSRKHDGGAIAPVRFVAREYPVDSIPHVFDYDRPSTLMVWAIDAIVVE